MGVAYLVYPGATHTRFEHSLGVMEVADKIYSKLRPNPDPYWKQILRLAALCHDMGHLPFSHTAEKRLLPVGGHEQMTRKLIESDELKAIWKEIGPNACADIIRLSVENHSLKVSDEERFLAKIITEDNFGADRIDYLLRDAYYTGASYGHFDYHQLIDCLKIIETPTPTIGILMAGMQSVESLWIARYMMYARVSHHSKVRLFSQHMGRVMEAYYQDVGFPKTVEGYIKERDYTILTVVQHYADQGNYHACALLQRNKPFQEVVWTRAFNQTALQQEFSSHILIDHVEQKKGHRDFPVLLENNVQISSKEASPFLTTIPLGVKGPFLFAHPNWTSKVHSWLATHHE